MKTVLFARSSIPILAILGLSALLAYWRALSLPFISDDYVQIDIARRMGPVENWRLLGADALYRCRATSLLLTYWTERMFGLNELVFNTSSLIIHVFNSWLVFALGSWKVVGYRVSAGAALFFAVYQGHQEAVIWYAAAPELLVFFFVVAGVLFWIRALRCEFRLNYGLVWGCFLLALLSKESAVVLVPLLVLVLLTTQSKETFHYWCVAPLAIVALAYFLWGYVDRPTHLHYNDGTFSLTAPFVVTVGRSLFRMLWFWGFLSLVAIWRWTASRAFRQTSLALAWMASGLVPYAFLTYMPHVPSRHTYIASAGLAFLFGFGLVSFHRRLQNRALTASVLGILIAHQTAYLWMRKQRQYELRAEPTERILRELSEKDAALHLRCFPYAPEVAVLAVSIQKGRRVELTSEGDANSRTIDFCGEAPVASSNDH